MKEAKPEWYARLKRGPFEGDVFDSELQREVEARAESGQPGRKRRRGRTGKTRLNIRTVALGAAAVLLIVLAALATSGRPVDSGRQASIRGGGEQEPLISFESYMELPVPNEGIRAVGSSGSGQFQLRPVKSGDESVQTLGAPSCLGQETDVHFFGDYELFFHRPSGEEAVVQSFEQLEMIWKGKETLEFRQLEFADMELFLFLPRYTDCHALEFYAYGVDKATGEASNYTFRDGENDLPYWTTSPQELPKVEDGMLVVEGGRWAGQDGAMRYTFEPVPDKHQLRLVDEERIP